MIDVSVIVVTHNRAEVLRETLCSLARLAYAGAWETLVVDNNSSDHTASIVKELQHTFPVPLRYVFEGQPGKYRGLNRGIEAAEGAFIAATDDDAYPERDWLDRAIEGFDRFDCGFVGGIVYPVWGGPPPRWVDPRDSVTGKVLGLQDLGPEPLEYGRALLAWPLGVNVAYRREVFGRVGPFDERLGRVAGTLRNQSQREWHLRARAAGVRGMYIPRMVVHHSVDAERLTAHYFRRWFYWHGVSRAILYRDHGWHLLLPEGDASHDGERHAFGVPMSVWREALRASVSAARRRLALQPDKALPYELTVCFTAGVLRQRWRDGRTPVPPGGRDAASADGAGDHDALPRPTGVVSER